jgi:hypothetical protein
MSLDQHASENHNTTVGYKSFERKEKFRYLGINLTNQYSSHEEIRGRLKSGNLVIY